MNVGNKAAWVTGKVEGPRGGTRNKVMTMKTKTKVIKTPKKKCSEGGKSVRTLPRKCLKRSIRSRKEVINEKI